MIAIGQQTKPPDWAQQQRWIPFFNFSGAEVPPFAALEVTDVYADGTLKCLKPTADGLTCEVFFNGPTAVPVDKFGRCTRDYPVTSFCTAGAPDDVGTVSGQWYLANTQKGFWVEGVLSAPDQICVVSYLGSDGLEGV